MKHLKNRIEIIKKVSNSFNKTLYYPQYFKEPVHFLGVQIIKGSWKYYYEWAEYFGVFQQHKVKRETLEDAQRFLDTKNFNEVSEYEYYP